MIIATGAEYRRIEAEGREEFEGLGVYYAATAMECQFCRGSTAIVVGGGNSAGQAAMFLSESAEKVMLVIRGGGLAATMSSYLSRRVETTPNIEILYHTCGSPRRPAVMSVSMTAGQTAFTRVHLEGGPITQVTADIIHRTLATSSSKW